MDIKSVKYLRNVDTRISILGRPIAITFYIFSQKSHIRIGVNARLSDLMPKVNLPLTTLKPLNATIQFNLNRIKNRLRRELIEFVYTCLISLVSEHCDCRL